jgi:hypothetical protein
MDDVFKHAMKQIFREAPPELVTGFQEKMEFIKVRYKHNEKTVQSCLEGMSKPPTLLELLTAAFVVNGGLLFKHGPSVLEEEEEEAELNQLMEEMASLGNDERLHQEAGSGPGSPLEEPAGSASFSS